MGMPVTGAARSVIIWKTAGKKGFYEEILFVILHAERFPCGFLSVNSPID
jgi:hypothetical protein